MMVVWQLKERGLCCKAFRKAIRDGTDSDYGFPLISEESHKWVMGNGLPKLSFCPWCGSKLAAPEKELTAYGRGLKKFGWRMRKGQWVKYSGSKIVATIGDLSGQWIADIATITQAIDNRGERYLDE